MKTYFALVAINNQTEVIEFTARNLSEAKEIASKSGQVIAVSLGNGRKIYF